MKPLSKIWNRALLIKVISIAAVMAIGFISFNALMPSGGYIPDANDENNNDDNSSDERYITIEVINEFEMLVVNKNFSFEVTDTLWDIHWKNNDYLSIGCNAQGYQKIDYTCSWYTPGLGYSLRAIAGVETTWYGNYLQLLQNGVRSNYGISSLTFKNRDVITWKWTNLS